MSQKYRRNLVNLWEEQDNQVSKIAKKLRVPKAQVIRNLVEIGLRAKLKDLK